MQIKMVGTRTVGCCCAGDEVVYGMSYHHQYGRVTRGCGFWYRRLSAHTRYGQLTFAQHPSNKSERRERRRSAAACVEDEETDAKALTPRPSPHLHSSKTSLMPLQIQVSQRCCKLIRVCTERAIVLISRCWLVNGHLFLDLILGGVITARGAA